MGEARSFGLRVESDAGYERSRATIAGVVGPLVIMAVVATSAAPLAASDVATTVSRAPNGVDVGTGESEVSAMTPDARFVVFKSQADNLIAGQAPSNNVNLFLFDRISKWNVAIHHVPGSPTTMAGGYAYSALVSANGRFVAFDSDSTNLVSGVFDPNAGLDVFLWDRDTDTVTLVSYSSASATQTGDLGSYLAGISADGRYVLYWSAASDLPGVSSDPNGTNVDLLLYDRLGSTRLVTHVDGAATTTLGDASQGAALSADGNWVAYGSYANDAVSGMTSANDDLDVFLWDRQAPASTAARLVSRSKLSATTTADAESLVAAISADGGEVLLRSVAADLEGSTSDANGSYDLFLYDRGADAVKLVSRNATSATQTTNGEVENLGIAISADGEYTTYRSSGTNVITGLSDSNAASDLFLWTRTGALTQLVSHAAGSSTQTANGSAGGGVAISADGEAVVFQDDGTDLVAGETDLNSAPDLFRWRRANGAIALLSHLDSSPLVTDTVGVSEHPLASSDGAFVAFQSSANDLVPIDDNNSVIDVFYSGPEEIFTDGFASGTPDAWFAVGG